MSLVKGSSFLPTSFVPSGNKLSGSVMNNRIQDPHMIGYPKGWRKGDTESWYKSQPTTKFTHLQYRKEREGPFYHEYIVIELDNDTVCRFDRRGDVATRAGAFTFEGMTAEDTAHVIQKHETHYAAINDNSDMVLRIHFPNGQDLLAILGICYGVQKDDETRAYTLTRYNCYFLSWTIITATARRTVDWAQLGKDTNKWEELVRTTIEGLSTESPSLRSRIKDGARTVFGLGRKNDSGPSSGLDAIPFVGATYLINTLRKALFNTRSNIQQSLGQLIFQTTVEDSMRQISDESAKKAGSEAARNHAGQAARDAAMEAIIETMWRTILNSENGAQLWEDQCKFTEEAVWKAASAAAEADEKDEDEAEQDGPEKWEEAWDIAWLDSWDKMSKGRGRSDDSVSDSDREGVSMRAKEAWKDAWDDACEANEKYVPLLSDGVAKYVTKNLDSLPQDLKIDMSTQSKMHALLAAMGTETKNSKLQEFIQSQIVDLCRRAGTVGITQSPAEIEEAMRRVWVETVKVLDDTN
ncbi:hypothetical protein FRC10_001373 [Ceratobasidium sp. 414]|nr:hypothetical protein FRC10_001373 [Ceratobasidium sp. 414]